MTRPFKILSLTVVLIFLLACNFVTQPLNDAQNLAQTAQSVASSLPVETLQAAATQIASAIPAETFQALPSAIPTVEALATEFGNSLNPQGAPVQEWRGIPVMSQATAGEEFGDTYSFRVNATVQEIQDYYNQQLSALGWTQPFEFPLEAEGGFLFYNKDDSVLTVFITPSEGSMVVLLTMA